MRRVERAPDELHRVEVGLGEHLGHLVGLVRADPVLAGDGPSGVETEGENLGGDALREIRLSLDPLVVADERVQVAVSGVEHVADAKA